MRGPLKTALALLLAASLAPMAFAGSNRNAPPDPSKDIHAYAAWALRDHFPNVVLRNQHGKPVHFYDDIIKGKVVMIQFMYTDCERNCPMVTPKLVKVQKQLRDRGISEVSLISITVNPAHDTPAVLKEYADKFKVQPGWQFLTGNKEDIDLIRRKLGVYDPDDKVNEHMNVLIMGKEPIGKWIAMGASAQVDDIAYTVMRLTGRPEYQASALH